MSESFSNRQGYKSTNLEINIREEAPEELRFAILLFAKNLGMLSKDLRNIVCDLLVISPNPSNFVDNSIWDEVNQLIQSCDWFMVYDVAEVIYTKFLEDQFYQITNPESPQKYCKRLNQYLQEHGIGWEMRDGQIQFRGSDTFSEITKNAVAALEKSGRTTATSEIREAINDISRRPVPDLSGSVQHIIVALEAIARDVTGKSKPNLGQLIQLLNLPEELDKAVKNIWRYSSEYARHRKEGQALNLIDVELLVSVAGALCTYLSKRHNQ